MRKTIALVIIASVLMMTALTVIFMTGNSLSQTDKGLDSAEKNSVCRFQTDRASKDGNWDRVDERCLKDEFVPDEHSEKVVAAEVKPDIT